MISVASIRGSEGTRADWVVGWVTAGNGIDSAGWRGRERKGQRTRMPFLS
jgi:hypothetical protein